MTYVYVVCCDATNGRPDGSGVIMRLATTTVEETPERALSFARRSVSYRTKRGVKMVFVPVISQDWLSSDEVFERACALLDSVLTVLEQRDILATSPRVSPHPIARAAFASPGTSITTEISPPSPQLPGDGGEIESSRPQRRRRQGSASNERDGAGCSDLADSVTPARSVHKRHAGKRSGRAPAGGDLVEELDAGNAGVLPAGRERET